ncbi:Serine/threonine-protein kinase PknD [Mycobacterium talmoniae]|uniref:non-specific serine/threonine protein kinase n=1 Tax=Mycobacterium talmoniae TaxID=1858794 RepID=A0A2S8BJM0_9MYCO|nr:Serine/threonine-protein kinase PknD [Mycobacterium talmoniae]
MDEVFGRYRLRGLLGAGGMGQVFRAYDTELHREVAIKVLPPQASTDPTFEQRFRREARTAAGLDEPHVVPIHDSGEIDGRLFIAMRLINGTDVATLLTRHGPMRPDQAVSIVEQAAAALDAAHEAGLVHRDVKPANLLVTPKNFVYLIDFGIARAPGETKLTSTGAAIGTVAYMAPERFTTGVADKRADVYALACVLHECLTGSTPYPVASVEQQMFAHVNGPPPRPSVIRPGVPPVFDDVVATGMAADPERRYQNAGDLAAAARRAVESTPAPSAPAVSTPATVSTQQSIAGTAAAPHHNYGAAGNFTAEPTALAPTQSAALPPVPRPTRRSRRRWIITLTGAMILAVAAATAIIFWGNHREDPAVAVDPTIHVGKSPYGVAVDSTTHTAYVTSYDDGTVSVIDTNNNTVTTTIHVGYEPRGVAVDATTHTAYVTNRGDSTVSVINTTNNTVTATIDVGTSPERVAVEPTTHAAYVTNLNDGTVSVIDTTNNTVTTTIRVGRSPTGVAVDATTPTAYVINAGDGTVSVIDTSTNTVINTVAAGKQPDDVAVDTTTHTAYVTNAGGGTVSVITR